MKRVLVIGYTQSGQLRRVLESLTAPLRAAPDVSVVTEELQPDPPYPFPWPSLQFFDVFPESVRGVPCRLKPLSEAARGEFDLVILGYQVWYLAPSIPVWSFLKSPDARALLQGRPVVTVIACRNMWLMAHERMRAALAELGARLVGNIALADRAPNWVSVVTIVLWMFSGRKERRWGVLPPPGVSDAEIAGAAGFGDEILAELRGPEPGGLQERLVQRGAVRLVPHLLLQERTASRAFRRWAALINALGGAGDPRRRPLLRLFQFCLGLAIMLLSPPLILAYYAALPFRTRRVQAEIRHFLEP